MLLLLGISVFLLFIYLLLFFQSRGFERLAISNPPAPNPRAFLKVEFTLKRENFQFFRILVCCHNPCSHVPNKWEHRNPCCSPYGPNSLLIVDLIFYFFWGGQIFTTWPPKKKKHTKSRANSIQRDIL